MPIRDLEQPLARADAVMVLRRQRRVAQADRILGDDTPVVGIELAVEPCLPSASVTATSGLRSAARPTRASSCEDRVPEHRERHRASVWSQPDHP